MKKERMPKVSVCVVTYNQENFIHQCLQSIVNQETGFNIEVIVGDDCSSDGTRVIVQEFADRYPEVVRPIFHEKNIGATQNYLTVHGCARGEYVAHIDGDDFMLPGKLQIMADCLAKNTLATAAVHKLKVVNRDGGLTGRIWPKKAPQSIEIGYMLKNHPVFGHSSLMYRKGVIDWTAFEKFEFIDFYVYLLLTYKGSIIFIDRALGCYRESVGISTNFYKYLPHIEFVFREAEKRGVSKQILKQARAYHLYKTSLYYLLVESSYEEFYKYIELSFEQAVIGMLQSIIFVFRKHPRLLYALHKHYKHLKHLGLIGR